jgi:hypothetical protein
MTFEYFMFTGGEDEVKRQVSYCTRCLEMVETIEEGIANN